MSSLSSVSHGFIDGFWRRLGILVAKITDFWRRLQIFGRRLRIFQRILRISLSLSMFTVHTNERGTCTCLH